MADKHKREFDSWLNLNYEKVTEHYRYLCFKKFSKISELEVTDLFNDSYGRVVKALMKKDEGFEVNYGNYFYHSLRMRAIQANIQNGKSEVKLFELMEYHDKQESDGDEEEVMDEFRIAVYKETIRFIEEKFEKRYIDIFKYRVLSGMSWPDMVEKSGMSKRTLHYWYNEVADAVHQHFKANKLRDIKLKEVIK